MKTVEEALFWVADQFDLSIVYADPCLGVNEFWNRSRGRFPDFEMGPLRASGLSVAAQTVVVWDTGPGDVLHELIHLILGPWSLREFCDEGYVLMPYEWQLARDVARRLPDEEALALIHSVDEYQQDTAIGGSQWSFGTTLAAYMIDNNDPRECAWWKKGLSRAQRLGLLDGDLMPTYKRPQWIGSGVAPRHPRWSPEYDHLYA